MRALRPNHNLTRRMAAATFGFAVIAMPVLGTASAANGAVAHAAVAHVRAQVTPRAVSFVARDSAVPQGTPVVTNTSVSGNDVTVTWDLNSATSDGGVAVELLEDLAQALVVELREPVIAFFAPVKMSQS